MQNSLKLDQASMNNLEKRQTAFLSLEDYHNDILNSHVKTLFASLSSQNIENQQSILY